MNCALCNRNSDSEYCSLHQRAFENIVRNYEYWRNANSISWKKYLKEIRKNPNSGMWVVDVSTYILSKNGDDKDK